MSVGFILTFHLFNLLISMSIFINFFFLVGLVCFSLTNFLRWTCRSLICEPYSFCDISIECYKFHSEDCFGFIPKILCFYTYVFVFIFILFMTSVLSNYVALCYGSKYGQYWWMFMCTWKFTMLCLVSVLYWCVL